MRFVLASASPARLATLRSAGLAPEVIVSGVDEDSVRASSTPRLVAALAEVKARAVASRVGTAWVLGCDSLLEFDGRSMGKPRDVEEARARWRAMRGGTGILHTGHALLEVADCTVIRNRTEVASVRVRFANIGDSDLEAYLATGEPLAVAGAFTIDGLGGWFVSGIEGDHHAVVGVSLPLLHGMLVDLGTGLADLGWPAA